MNNKFHVQISKFQKINQIDNAWSAEDFKALLEIMGLDDGLEGMSENELEEMCIMSLSDFEADESAKFVMSYLIKKELSKGKIEQIGHDMLDGELWEEFPDISFHERFFNAYSLLRKAYKGVFAKPTGVKFVVDVTAKKMESLNAFNISLEATMVRLLSSTLDEDAILNRLYDEKIASNDFEEAKNILWSVSELAKSDLSVRYEIISSEFWFGDLEEIESFDGVTHADEKSDKD